VRKLDDDDDAMIGDRAVFFCFRAWWLLFLVRSGRGRDGGGGENAEWSLSLSLSPILFFALSLSLSAFSPRRALSSSLWNREDAFFFFFVLFLLRAITLSLTVASFFLCTDVALRAQRLQQQPAAAAAAAWATTSFTTSSRANDVDAYKVGDSTNIKWHEGSVDQAIREKTMGQKGCVLWFTGLSGSGKSTVAYTLEHELFKRGNKVVTLDGDNIRHGLNSNLGFTAEDREENIRRIGEVSKLFADAGMITLVSFISPYKRDRLKVRERVGDKFLEVYMKIPLSVCEERDPKGLYKAARAGKIKGFTGIDDPYEEPENAEIEMKVAGEDGVLAPPREMALEMVKILEQKGFLSA
jgi:adenylylsulfate kinase